MLEPVRISGWDQPRRSQATVDPLIATYERALLVAVGCAALFLSLGAVALATTL
jgi:hypothetical protein